MEVVLGFEGHAFVLDEDEAIDLSDRLIEGSFGENWSLAGYDVTNAIDYARMERGEPCVEIGREAASCVLRFLPEDFLDGQPGLRTLRGGLAEALAAR